MNYFEIMNMFLSKSQLGVVVWWREGGGRYVEIRQTACQVWMISDIIYITTLLVVENTTNQPVYIIISFALLFLRPV